MFNDWNSFDNISGVKSYTMNGFDDLKVQIHQDIHNTFPDDADQDTRLLAQDMHTSSQVFAADFFWRMDTLYQELCSTSVATEEEAWELVSACVKKVFEELRWTQAPAANAT
jgi:hypothetical protein